MTEAVTVVIEEAKFAALMEMRTRVKDSLVSFNAAREDAKAKGKIYEAARSTFEREFDRLVRSTKGDDLPLFNQSELIERAQADPVVMKLVDRLVGRGHDVNAILVAGYTEDERNQASAWLDALDAKDAAEADGHEYVADMPEMPAFLAPQELTALEVADLLRRCGDAGCDDTITAEVVKGWGPSVLATVRAWLADVERIKAEKGEAVTFDDLPETPACLQGQAEAHAPADGEDGAHDADELEPEHHDQVEA